MANELEVIAKDNQLSNTKIQELLSNFGEDYKQAETISKEASSIVVSSEDDIKTMGIARKKRLELKNIRVNVEKIRKTLKEDSLREGKAIDGIANVIKALIVPVEQHLETQEKFAEVRAAERKAKRHADRIEKLSQFVDDVSFYSLEDITDEQFTALLEQCKKSYEEQQAAIKQAELDRITAEKAEKEEQERIRKENEKLKQEAKQREAELEKQRIADEKAREAERKEQEEKIAAEQKQAAIEREKREALEKEQADKLAAEKLAKEKAEEAERQALLAPDKEKLLAFAQVIDAIEIPNVSNREAGKVLDETVDFLERISKNLRNKAKEL